MRQTIPQLLNLSCNEPIEADPEEEARLSHAVINHDGETYDSEGVDAADRWEDTFNHNQWLYGDDEVSFYQCVLPEPTEQFLKTALDKYGDDTKLVDRPELRKMIVAVARTLMAGMS